MGKISVVINTLNEENNLARAISSVDDFADEVVVVDMMSTDKTREIARKMGAKVFRHVRTGYVEPARNYAISKAKNEWILVLDADEKISKKLAKLLLSEVNNPRGDYYRLPRKNIIFGKWLKYSRWWPDYNIRFFRKGYVSWNEVIHAVPMTKGMGVDIEASKENAIIHYHYENVEQFVLRLNRYTTEHAKVLAKEGYKFHWTDLISKPSNEFLSRYFFGEGYKDGLHGLSLSGLQAFSEFVLYLKLWQDAGFKRKRLSASKVYAVMKKSEKDLHFWQDDLMFKETGDFVYKLKKKLRI